MEYNKKLTLKDLTDFLKELEKIPRREPVYDIPADDYPFMSDEQFKVFVENVGINFRFIGGQEGCKRMVDRCKKLNIEIN